MKDDRLYLHHMLERCSRITRFIVPGRAAIMASVGEAAKHVFAEARDHLLLIDWKAICGMRGVLIHDYIGVDLDEVRNVASERRSELQTALEQFMAGAGAG